MYDISYITIMYEISYISWNRRFHIGLGGVFSRACRGTVFSANRMALVSADRKSSALREIESFSCFSGKRRTYGPWKLMYDISYLKIEY
jgi:hypothetical protein